MSFLNDQCLLGFLPIHRGPGPALVSGSATGPWGHPVSSRYPLSVDFLLTLQESSYFSQVSPLSTTKRATLEFYPLSLQLLKLQSKHPLGFTISTSWPLLPSGSGLSGTSSGLQGISLSLVHEKKLLAVCLLGLLPGFFSPLSCAYFFMKTQLFATWVWLAVMTNMLSGATKWPNWLQTPINLSLTNVGLTYPINKCQNGRFCKEKSYQHFRTRKNIWVGVWFKFWAEVQVGS